MTSKYPDGTTRQKVEVVIPRPARAVACVIDPDNVEAVVCHRLNAYTAEEYLIKWRGPFKFTPYSWHSLYELARCLSKVQNYVDGFTAARRTTRNGRKRKTPSDSEDASENHSSMSFDSSVPSNPPDYEYYGRIIRFNGSITIKEPGTTTSKFFYEPLPNDEMKNVASKCDTRQADYHIRTEFSRRLSPIPGPYVCIRNDLDESTPSLDFSFVSDSVLGAGVEARDPETTIGCNSENDPGGCRPHMGQGIGCEYGRKCDCQEFAAIDIQRLKAEEREKYKKGDMLGLPKRFPYYSVTSNRPECLVNFYLESRHPIYECNVCCNCGPDCKTRVVQKGRKVKLQIFKTLDRGWGLRTLEDLKEGQFIDTYRGEIITTQEADRREKIAEKDKASYQYALDKYAGEEDLTEDNCYVVDGEFMGGPTRFMNHSCHPNCRQYTVSYNKYDYRIYQLAFFAYTAIKAGTELTFDYLDKDDEDEDNTGESTRDVDKDDPLECRCGSLKCRKRLWI